MLYKLITLSFISLFCFLPGISSEKLSVIHNVSSDSIQIPLLPSGTYKQKRLAVLQQKNKFRQAFYQAANPDCQKEILDSAGKYLTSVIVNDLIPHWYGTPWSFEGYTEIPNQGSIACGYFVSTVLQHAGFNLNRYKMAQQNPECEVLTLHQNPNYIMFNANTTQALTDSVKLSLEEGLYIFGKENHVGFMLHCKGQVYLIHSSYQAPTAFVKPEFLQEGGILHNPPYIFFGAISTNHKLIKQWIDSQPITVVLPGNGK